MTLQEWKQRRRAWWLALALGAGIPLLRIACSALGVSEGRYHEDETRYYLPAIRLIAAQWPGLDFDEHAPSATAPGYLWVLAGWGKLAGLDSTTLRLCNWLVSAAALAVLLRQLFALCPPWQAALLALPLSTSNFFLKSASWVVTDNAGLLLTLAALACGLRESSSRLTSAAAGLWAGAAVLARQTQIWICLPTAVGCGLASWREGQRRRAVGLAALAILPAAAALGWLVLQWHGLVPRRWAAETTAISATGPVYFWAVLGVFGPAYWLSVRSPSESLRPAGRWLLGAALAAVLLWSLAPSTQFYASGRWGGYLWSLSLWAPSLGGRSFAFLPLVLLGACSLALLGRMLWQAGEHHLLLVLGVALLACTVSFIPNRNAFHRYFEPPALVLLALVCAPLARRQFRLFPLLLVGALQLAWTILALFLIPLGF